MALIPALIYEEKIQINDKTRLDASNSFATTGETAISTMTIVAGLGATSINIYNADATRRYTDWAYTSWTFDIDSTNDKVYFKENGTSYTGTLVAGNYTLTTLLAAVDVAMTTASGLSYTITADSSNKITITSSSSSLVLVGTNQYNSILNHIGFIFETESKQSHVGYPVEYAIKKVVITINNGGTAVVQNFYQKLYSVSGDKLFSSDLDLISEESSINKYVPTGKSSFLFMHRRSQEKIMEWIDQNGYVNVYDKKFTKFDIIDILEVRAWSKYLCLELIFRDIGNAKDDVFKQKADYFEKMAIAARNRVVLRLDVNEDGKADQDTSPDTWSASMVRR